MLRKRYLQTCPCGPDFMLHNAILHDSCIYLPRGHRDINKINWAV